MPKNLMSHVVLVLCAVFSADARSLSPAAKEFIEISQALEPVQCEKHKLRREIALAEAERRDARPLRERFAALEPRVKRSSDPEDLDAISRQHREAFYRCE